MRTDNNNNPAAFTSDLAKEAHLVLGVDYEVGDIFPAPSKLHTARLLGDPIAVTIKLIDTVSFFTKSGQQRWTYMNMPKTTWDGLTYPEKVTVIGHMYQMEGGTKMRDLFTVPINLTVADTLKMGDRVG